MVPVQTNGAVSPSKTNGVSVSEKKTKIVNKIDDEELDKAFKNWMSWDKNPKTRVEIQRLMDEEKLDELRKLLLKRLSFGTAGLRGKMGPGTSQMNDLVIIQTSQGLANYVAQVCGGQGDGKRLSVVIAYDGRHNSRRFAELTAAAFVNKDFKVYLTTKVCPTPFVPFGVDQLGAQVGVMITASHNPKEDNGYKVYWGNGAQIIPPHDKGIQKCIMEHLEPAPNAWNTDFLTLDTSDVEDPLPLISPKYYEILTDDTSFIGEGFPVKLTYTAMHGVGYPYVMEALISTGADVVVVEEQRDPDPEFSTVKFPNPEEGKSALNLAIKYADANNCPIILANDPDADRLAVAEKLPSGEWKIFNGNELGALLGNWMYHCFMDRYTEVQPSDCYMLASTVSSKFLKTMAEHEGFNFIETLTGFKWMGNRAHELIKEGKHVIFAFEEAIGFMTGAAVLDKDGVSAAAHVAQMAGYLYQKGFTLEEQLTLLYQRYGHHVSHNSYYICHEPAVINKVFENIRNFSGTNGTAGYPIGLLDNKIQVTAVRDLTTGYDSEESDKKAKLPVSKSSHMITFKFDNGLVLTLRTSGTEPKVKYYSELRAEPGKGDREGLQNKLDSLIKVMVNEWLLPEKWGLIPRSD